MKTVRGRWSPSPQQISLALDCVAARVPITRAAELLDVKPRTLWVFARRLDLPLFRAWRDACAGEQPSSSGGRSMPMTAPHPRSPAQGASLAVWSKRRSWRARIYYAGKERSLGYFATKEEARQAHADAARHLGLRLKEDRPA
jgi:hypothetical protein